MVQELIMGELASQAQLRQSLLRWVLVTVPAIVFLGFLSGRASGSAADNAWYLALAKPVLTPPGWIFPVAWTILYIMLGVVLAMLIHARGAKKRGLAITLFGAQFLLNLAWSPLFFGAHQVSLALLLLLAILALAIWATFVIKQVRATAAWLMLPYLVWLGFATALNFGIDRLNPDAELLVPAPPPTEIIL
jgi:translocator protein